MNRLCHRLFLGSLLSLTIAGGELARSPAQAVQFSDGTVSFIQQPSLVGAVTTESTAYASWANYYFTIALPEGADEPLGKVVIQQTEGVDRIRYDLEETAAFTGPRKKGEPLPLGDIIYDRAARQMTVVFDPPVPPGTTVTLKLSPIHNPGDGVYMFGVTAFPRGEKVRNYFMGFGRLHFYRLDGGLFW